MKRAAILAWALAFAAPLASFGADPPRVREASGGSAPLVAITGVTVHTGTGPILEDAGVLREGGVVREVGKGLAVPRGAIVTARRGAVVTAGLVEPFLAGPVSFDRLGARDDNAALLHAAGVPIALTSGETHNARKLRQAAGNAVRAGLPHEAAIQAITRGPAEAFGLDGRVGTLEAGKAANLVVWSGDPLEIGTRVLSVYVRGREVELRSRQTELFEKYKELH